MEIPVITGREQRLFRLTDEICLKINYPGQENQIRPGVIYFHKRKTGVSKYPVFYTCEYYQGGGYTDWFLPSKEELLLIKRTLSENGLGDFSGKYWSSSADSDSCGAWCVDMTDNGFVSEKESAYRVRPVRAF